MQRKGKNSNTFKFFLVGRKNILAGKNWTFQQTFKTNIQNECLKQLCNQPCFKTCKKKKVRNQSMKNEKERKKQKTF